MGAAGYPDFVDFLAKMALGIWDDEDEGEPEDDGDLMVPA